MKKHNFRKIGMLGALFLGMGSFVLAFQNFTPHDPFKGHDTSDLFMNGALSDAVKEAKEEYKVNRPKLDAETLRTGILPKKEQKVSQGKSAASQSAD